MRFRSLNKKMMMVCKQDQSFGIISKFLEFKASRPEPRMQHASFVILKSLVAVHLELLPIFLVDLFSTRRKPILNLVYQCVKVVTIGINNSNLLRKNLIKRLHVRKQS